MMKYLLYSVTFLAFMVNIMFPIVQNFSLFTEKYQPNVYESKYNNSQYIIPQSKHPISDEELLAHAGYQYVVKGINPILINSDHPPLGKYIIGIFIAIMGNHRVVSLFFGLGTFALFGLILWNIKRSTIVLSIGMLLLSFDTMLIDQIIHSPILDIIQVFFFHLYCLVLLRWVKKYSLSLTILLGIILGCIASIKLYFPALILLGVTSSTLFLYKRSILFIIKNSLMMLVVGCCVYTLTYIKYFMEGNSLRSFMGVQKWIYLFWQNNSVDRSKLLGSVIPFILFNKWKVWWGTKEYISFERWSLMWPTTFISTIGLGMAMIKYKGRHLSFMLLFYLLWVVVFTLYLCFLPISPRYLMLLFHPSYIIMSLCLTSLLFSKESVA